MNTYRKHYTTWRNYLREWSNDENDTTDFNSSAARAAASFIASEFGESIKDELGGGAYGIAYLLQSGKVLKLTSSLTEVTAAIRLRKRRKLQHVVSYYDARYVDDGSYNYFALILDGVTTLTNDQQEIYQTLRRARWAEHTASDEEVKERLERIMPDAVSGKISALYINNPFLEYLLKNRSTILKQWKLYNVAAYEAHYENVGFDQFGNFVAFDIVTTDEVYDMNTSTIEMRSLYQLKNMVKHIIIQNETDMKTENFYHKWRQYLSEQQRVVIDTTKIKTAGLRDKQNTEYSAVTVISKQQGSLTISFVAPKPVDTMKLIIPIQNIQQPTSVIPSAITTSVGNNILTANIPTYAWRTDQPGTLETIFELQGVGTESNKLSIYIKLKVS